MPDKKYIRTFETLTIHDVPLVGGKNASLGEMVRSLKEKGVRVPDGFATTSEAYWDFLDANQLTEQIKFHVNGIPNKKESVQKAGRLIRRLFLESEFPPELADQIRAAYRDLGEKTSSKNVAVAVRSSATAEDLPNASFAGQQETFLNIKGEDQVIDACRRCFASLFTDRAIVYRQEKGFDHMKVALSIGIQRMVRSDLAGSGVMFSIDTETGFPNVVVINAAWGLGETVVQGSVDPDEVVVFKPLLENNKMIPILEKIIGRKEQKMVYAQSGNKTTKTVPTTAKEQAAFVLNDDEILTLAKWATTIEKHYGTPMDMEWAKDGKTNELFVVQARPETVQSQKEKGVFKTYALKEKGKKLLQGLAIGDMIAVGKVQVIKNPKDLDRFESGSILVTTNTDPDWVSIMKKAAGIVTDHGGRTSHAAIVSRELGIPALVGTGTGTAVLKNGDLVTLSCAEGENGFIYKGKLPFEEIEVDLEKLPITKTQIMMNMASPEAAFRWWRLPARGVGLARMEFIISDLIKVHPMALVHFERVKNKRDQTKIQNITRGFRFKSDYFVDHLAQGISKIAASQYPHPVIVRMSDFKTNEYANLIGGKNFEPIEENPMIGFRGASRYYDDRYREGFSLECQALKRVRDTVGLTNVLLMIPFCRTLEEADKVLAEMAKNGLKRGENGLEVYVMCEIPSNVVLAEGFADRFDGFSIGSNDLTQLTLGVDRDSMELAHLFDERNEAVKSLIREVIEKAHKKNRKVGICGQAPSDYPDFAEFLVRAGIDSISLNPDSIVPILRRVIKMEQP
ncbi:MAG: Phosphoenolpyruvate synthase [Elusimicrobia bacterium]|nr:Phosphoenolpyruvate synthase [Elusimicrobiota bacterium]